MPKPQRKKQSGDEFFYVDADGKKRDAELHNAILDEGDHEAAKAVSDKIKARILAEKHDEVEKFFYETRKREQTEVELWPEEGEARGSFMSRCVDALIPCVGEQRGREICSAKWHKSRRLGKKGFVTLGMLDGDEAVEPCGKKCEACEGADAPFDQRERARTRSRRNICGRR